MLKTILYHEGPWNTAKPGDAAIKLKQQETETASQDGSLRGLELGNSCTDAPVPVWNKWKERTFVFLFRFLLCQSPIILIVCFFHSKWLITLPCSNCFSILLKPEVFGKGGSYWESETCNYWLSLTKRPQGQPLGPVGCNYSTCSRPWDMPPSGQEWGQNSGDTAQWFVSSELFSSPSRWQPALAHWRHTLLWLAHM